MNLFRQGKQTIRQFASIRCPVAKGRPVVVTMAKPAVVQHKKLNAHIGGCLCNLQQLFLIKVEVGSFPVIQQNGTRCLGILSTNQMVGANAMELTAHAVQAIVRVNEHCFRGAEDIPSGKLPGETILVQPQANPSLAETIHFHPCIEVAAVDEGCGIDFALSFRCAGCQQGKER